MGKLYDGPRNRKRERARPTLFSPGASMAQRSASRPAPKAVGAGSVQVRQQTKTHAARAKGTGARGNRMRKNTKREPSRKKTREPPSEEEGRQSEQEEEEEEAEEEEAAQEEEVGERRGSESDRSGSDSSGSDSSGSESDDGSLVDPKLYETSQLASKLQWTLKWKKSDEAGEAEVERDNAEFVAGTSRAGRKRKVAEIYTPGTASYVQHTSKRRRRPVRDDALPASAKNKARKAVTRRGGEGQKERARYPLRVAPSRSPAKARVRAPTRARSNSTPIAPSAPSMSSASGSRTQTSAGERRVQPARRSASAARSPSSRSKDTASLLHSESSSDEDLENDTTDCDDCSIGRQTPRARSARPRNVARTSAARKVPPSGSSDSDSDSDWTGRPSRASAPKQRLRPRVLPQRRATTPARNRTRPAADTHDSSSEGLVEDYVSLWRRIKQTAQPEHGQTSTPARRQSLPRPQSDSSAESSADAEVQLSKRICRPHSLGQREAPAAAAPSPQLAVEAPLSPAATVTGLHPRRVATPRDLSYATSSPHRRQLPVPHSAPRPRVQTGTGRSCLASVRALEQLLHF